MSTNEVDIIEEYNSEKAKARLFKRIDRRRKDDAFMHQGARQMSKSNIIQDAKAFQEKLNSMAIVEETNNMVRYSSMPEIEFTQPLPLQIKIPSSKDIKKYKLLRFKKKLEAIGSSVELNALDCASPIIEFKEIGT